MPARLRIFFLALAQVLPNGARAIRTEPICLDTAVINASEAPNLLPGSRPSSAQWSQSDSHGANLSGHSGSTGDTQLSDLDLLPTFTAQLKLTQRHNQQVLGGGVPLLAECAWAAWPRVRTRPWGPSAMLWWKGRRRTRWRCGWSSWAAWRRWLLAPRRGRWQLGCVFHDMKPPKSILRKSTDMQKPIQRVKFTKAIARHTKIRDPNPSLGYICPGEPHQRSPNAPKFEDQSQEETEWQEQGAREAAWKLAKKYVWIKGAWKSNILLTFGK